MGYPGGWLPQLEKINFSSQISEGGFTPLLVGLSYTYSLTVHVFCVVVILMMNILWSSCQGFLEGPVGPFHSDFLDIGDLTLSQPFSLFPQYLLPEINATAFFY